MTSDGSNKLTRVLGFWMATALVIGTVIGSGVFKKPHAVSKDLTEFGLIMAAWVLVGVLTFLGSLILAEVAIIHPRAGGNYAFLREGYGRWAGFLWGWVEFWIIRSGSIAALASVFTDSFHDILYYARGGEYARPADVSWERQGVTITVIVVLALVNARGTVLGGGLQVLVTSVKVITLLSIALLPFIYLAFTRESAVKPELLEPIWPADASSIDLSKFGKAMVGILWAYHGWMNLAPVAEEVKDPGRNLPLAFMTGTLAVIVLYVSVNVAYHLVVTRDEMRTLGMNTPVASLFAEHLFGPIGLMLASIAIMISVFGALNGNLLVGPRLLYAMGKDGLAPNALCHLHPTYGTPLLAQVVLTSWSILLVIGAALLIQAQVLVKPLFDILTDYAMFGAVSFETMAVASIFMCRRQFPVDKVALPYRCWGYPLIPIVYVAAMGAVLVNMFVTDLKESLIAVGFIATGAVLYLVVFAFRAAPPLESAAAPADGIRAGDPPIRTKSDLEI